MAQIQQCKNQNWNPRLSCYQAAKQFLKFALANRCNYYMCQTAAQLLQNLFSLQSNTGQTNMFERRQFIHVWPAPGTTQNCPIFGSPSLEHQFCCKLRLVKSSSKEVGPCNYPRFSGYLCYFQLQIIAWNPIRGADFARMQCPVDLTINHSFSINRLIWLYYNNWFIAFR